MATAASRLRSAPKPDEGSSTAGQNLSWVGAVPTGDDLQQPFADATTALVNGLWLAQFLAGKIDPSINAANGAAFMPVPRIGVDFAELLGYVSLLLLVCASTGVYDRRNSTDKRYLVAVVFAVILATTLFALCVVPLHLNSSYWQYVASMGTCNIAALVGWRLLHRYAVSRSADSVKARHALVIGSGETGKRLANYLAVNPQLGYTVKGFLDDFSHEQPTVLGGVSDFHTVALAEFIDDVFVASNLAPALIDNLCAEARQCGVTVKLVPHICAQATAWECVGDFPVMLIRAQPIPRLGLLFKRALDILGATVGLLVLMPLFVLIGIMIRLDSPGPILYRALRVGEKGRKFRCLKFRTMLVNADQLKSQLHQLNERVGPIFKITNDPRVTRIGKWLRRYSLDELPQLWNVLRRDMSLVGPRPHPLDDYDQYELDHRLRLKVAPGLTGLWQITARTDPSFDRNMALDLEYIRNWSIWLDLEILIRTVPAVLRGEGS